MLWELSICYGTIIHEHTAVMFKDIPAIVLHYYALPEMLPHEEVFLCRISRVLCLLWDLGYHS